MQIARTFKTLFLNLAVVHHHYLWLDQEFTFVNAWIALLHVSEMGLAEYILEDRNIKSNTYEV